MNSPIQETFKLAFVLFTFESPHMNKEILFGS